MVIIQPNSVDDKRIFQRLKPITCMVENHGMKFNCVSNSMDFPNGKVTINVTNVFVLLSPDGRFVSILKAILWMVGKNINMAWND